MEEQFDLRFIVGIIFKRRKVFIAIILISVLLAGTYTAFFAKTEYVASTDLIVVSGHDSDVLYEWQINAVRKIVKTYGVLVERRLILEKVIENLNLSISPGELRSSVSVNYIDNTEIMTITVRSLHPLLATNIANEIAENLIYEASFMFDMDNIVVIDPAVSASPVKPRHLLNITIALVLGFMSGIGTVYFLEFLDNTIKTPRDVKNILNLPLLGNIPFSPPRVKSFPCRDPLTGAYRFMVNNIQYAGLDKEIKSILITPTSPEGTNITMCANLGIMLSKGGSSVLLIDAVFNNPTLHKIFDLKNKKGFSNVILDENFVPEEVINETGNAKLHVITGGSNGPNMAMAKPLSLQRINKLLDIFEEEYDYVIFNTPQLITYTDAAVIATCVDATILVFDYGKVNKEEVVSAKEQLERAKANIIGVVINNVPSQNEDTVIPKFNINGNGHIKTDTDKNLPL